MTGFRERLGQIIFEVDTPTGRAFDIALLITILLSTALIMLESVASYRMRYGELLRDLEWLFTALFTAEYFARIYTARDRRKYLSSFFGIVDLLAILPGYLSLLFVGSQYFIVIRALRLLRVFRVLKLVRFLGEANTLTNALRASRKKIIVFMIAILTLVVLMGSAMYLIEGPENGFTSIPISVYWAIVTLTTVGYGDIAPKTPFGQFLSAALMILGYGVIAVPTGIVTTELSLVARESGALPCPHCGRSGHTADAVFCKYCGGALAP